MDCEPIAGSVASILNLVELRRLKGSAAWPYEDSDRPGCYLLICLSHPLCMFFTFYPFVPSYLSPVSQIYPSVPSAIFFFLPT